MAEDERIDVVLREIMAMGQSIFASLPEDAASAKKSIEVITRAFGRTGNPLWAWAAFKQCRVARLEYPDWVLKYFEDSADNLFKIAQRAPDGSQINEPAKAVATAIGMSAGRGKPTPFAAFSDHGWMVVGWHVAQQIQNGDKETIAIEVVAERYEISNSTARTAFKRFASEFPDIKFSSTEV